MLYDSDACQANIRGVVPKLTKSKHGNNLNPHPDALPYAFNSHFK